MKLAIGAVALSLVWGGAAAAQGTSRVARPDAAGARPQSFQGWTTKQVLAFFADRTRVTWGPSHGTQVAYTSRDGRSYLWYPGNPTVLAGRWEVRERAMNLQDENGTIRTVQNPSVCFAYGANTYNPATGHSGGGWECALFGFFARSVGEARSGDTFGLSKRTPVPFVLPRQERLTFQEIVRRGRGPR